uniref:Uncharacterized protein n=1 Tax=Anguilla anguilla TaxID=7936 RepID=A0A0E9QWH0_ANGAN
MHNFKTFCSRHS